MLITTDQQYGEILQRADEFDEVMAGYISSDMGMPIDIAREIIKTMDPDKYKEIAGPCLQEYAAVMDSQDEMMATITLAIEQDTKDCSRNGVS